MHRAEKCNTKNENLYYNFKKGAFIFVATENCLKTEISVGKYTQNYEACVICRKEI